MKKVTSTIMSLVFVFLCFGPAYAANNEKTTMDFDKKYTRVEIVEDTDKLNQIIIDENLQIPDGYSLVKVETIVCNSPSVSNETISQNNRIENRGIIYELCNIRPNVMEFYYVNDYSSDYFDGPCEVSETYTKTATVKLECDLNIGESTISAGVGYDIELEYQVSKSLKTTVAKNEILNVRTHINYSRTDFDVRNKWTNKIVREDDWSAKPVGLVFKLYTYAK